MNVALRIIWRPTPDRMEGFKIAYDRLSNLYEFSSIGLIDSGHPNFNRAASRNLAVRDSGLAGATVVVVADADSIPERVPLHDSVAAAVDGKMHFPFDIVWYIDKRGMAKARQGLNPEQIKSRIVDKCQSEGGIWVCTPETWWKCGGQDERLVGWGAEDRSFLAVTHTILGPSVFHPGVLLCMPHDISHREWLPEDVHYLIETQNLYQQPELMKEYIRGRADNSVSLPGETS